MEDRRLISTIWDFLLRTGTAQHIAASYFTSTETHKEPQNTGCWKQALFKEKLKEQDGV